MVSLGIRGVDGGRKWNLMPNVFSASPRVDIGVGWGTRIGIYVDCAGVRDFCEAEAAPGCSRVVGCNHE